MGDKICNVRCWTNEHVKLSKAKETYFIKLKCVFTFVDFDSFPPTCSLIISFASYNRIRENFCFVCIASLKTFSIFLPKPALDNLKYLGEKCVSTLKWPQLINLTTASTNAVKSGKGPFLSGTSKKWEHIMENIITQITYAKTSWKLVLHKQVRCKILWFFRVFTGVSSRV